MNRAGRFLLCSLLIVASHSLATDYHKLSGYVKHFASYGEAQAGLSRGSTATSERSAAHAERTLTAFLKADEAQIEELCSNYGLRLFTRLGDIAIVGIPLSSIGPLSEHPAVRRIEANPSGHLAMDTTTIIVGADKLYSPAFIQQQQPFTGQG